MSRILLVVITFVWCGLLIGISFIEAPLKFQAPGITLELGLGIGKLVFGMLNKIEVVLAILAGISLISVRTISAIWLPYAVVVILVAVQTFYFLPALDMRADMVIAGETPPASPIHWMYIAAEVLKLGLLLWCGIAFLRKNFR